MDTLSNSPEPIEVDVSGDDANDLAFSHPGTLGLVAFVLAILTLMGTRAFEGALYTVAFGPHDNGLGEITGSRHAYVVAAAVLAALFALVPLVLARIAQSRLIPDDGVWTAHLVRAATVLGAISFVLAVVRVLVALSLDETRSLYYG